MKQSWSQIVQGTCSKPKQILKRPNPAKAITMDPNEDVKVEFAPELLSAMEPLLEAAVAPRYPHKKQWVAVDKEKKKIKTKKTKKCSNGFVASDENFKKESVLVFLDLEFSSLEEDGVLFEVSVLLTNNRFDDMGLYHGVRHLDDPEQYLKDPQLYEMHKKNGLLQAVKDSKKTVQDIDKELVTYLTDACAGKPWKYDCYPAGMTLHYDMIFMKKELPSFFALLKHQTLEVKSFQIGNRLFSPTLQPNIRRFEPLHRSLPDVYSALQLWMFYVQILYWGRSYVEAMDFDSYQYYISELMNQDQEGFGHPWSGTAKWNIPPSSEEVASYDPMLYQYEAIPAENPLYYYPQYQYPEQQEYIAPPSMYSIVPPPGFTVDGA